ncbi:PQQ-binding-like beta-propeller repeat protein [Promicromonospora iranensis]|uniref:Outer membrane protein assembly factor BamB n=1 Tax=Promicromonospora iranensis TaxID=1105144 RepID=A0ABU2CP95_9MICO|nr:PQQ-binding-like beta-propeller repeat protein [Promicromonospora iranensis]MDR7383145.1 outer membrane protein assembly factor BamB [Promicromonospora iranensis]
MARDRDPGGAFVFDLIDDGAADPEGPLAPPGAGSGGEQDGAASAPGESSSGELGRRVRAVAPAAAVLAILFGTGLALDGARDGARMDRMRDMHGGVVDVSSPLVETWRWEGAVGSRRALAEGLGAEAAVLEDVLVFETGTDLVALDAATGVEAWMVPLGADADCGPMGSAGWGEVTTTGLVCLVGSGADRAATVVGPDGVVSSERVLDPADGRRFGAARPGPDGTVLRGERVGRAPTSGLGDAECTDMGECTGTVEAGQDLALRAEDALTGEERWRVTIPFRPTPANQCANWYGTSWDGGRTAVDLSDMLDSGAFGARISDMLVQLYGCGIEAAVTADGVLLGTEIEPGAGGVARLRSGGYTGYMFDEEVRTVLYDTAGDAVGEVDGYAAEPVAVDGSGPDTFVGVGGPGARTRAYEPDGTLRWEVEEGTDNQMFLAQVAGTAVILSSTGSVRGLDLLTGEKRWTWNGSGSDETAVYVSRAFTDGQFVLLLTENGYGGTGLVSLDAVSGEVAWEQHDDAADSGTGGRFGGTMMSVDGNLVEVRPDGIRGLG